MRRQSLADAAHRNDIDHARFIDNEHGGSIEVGTSHRLQEAGNCRGRTAGCLLHSFGGASRQRDLENFYARTVIYTVERLEDGCLPNASPTRNACERLLRSQMDGSLLLLVQANSIFRLNRCDDAVYRGAVEQLLRTACQPFANRFGHLPAP